MNGRYSIVGSLGSGGMARVYLGRVAGSAGFTRLVAIKRLHAELAAEEQFVAMLLDEARLTARIRHPNVVGTLDLVASDSGFSVVMEYVEGDSLSSLMKAARESEEPVPLPIALAIVHGVLRGLEAAHEARDDDGQPLGIVHRDVSPQNVLVGVDGIPRIIDFGIAKSLGRLHSTRPGEVRGKFSYMAPEQMQEHPATRQADVYATGVILWELLAGRPLFASDDARTVCLQVMRGAIPPPSQINPAIPPELDAVVLEATHRDLGRRHLTAREFAAALTPWTHAEPDEVGMWVRSLAAERLAERQRMLQVAVASPDGRPIDELMAELDPPTLQVALRDLPEKTIVSETIPVRPVWSSPLVAAAAVAALLIAVGTFFVVRPRGARSSGSERAFEAIESLELPDIEPPLPPSEGGEPEPPSELPAEIPPTGTEGDTTAAPATTPPRSPTQPAPSAARPAALGSADGDLNGGKRKPASATTPKPRATPSSTVDPWSVR